MPRLAANGPQNPPCKDSRSPVAQQRQGACKKARHTAQKPILSPAARMHMQRRVLQQAPRRAPMTAQKLASAPAEHLQDANTEAQQSAGTPVTSPQSRLQPQVTHVPNRAAQSSLLPRMRQVSRQAPKKPKPAPARQLLGAATKTHQTVQTPIMSSPGSPHPKKPKVPRQVAIKPTAASTKRQEGMYTEAQYRTHMNERKDAMAKLGSIFIQESMVGSSPSLPASTTTAQGTPSCDSAGRRAPSADCQRGYSKKVA